MSNTTPAPEPTGLLRVVGALIQHSEDYGRIWFGLVFWGSVLFAVGRRIWPDTAEPTLLIVAALIGLAGGLVAHVRGYWL